MQQVVRNLVAIAFLAVASPFALEAFSAQSFRTLDGHSAITLVSSDEAEYHHDGATFLCKYTSKNDAIRVIQTILGTQQVLYFRKTPSGLAAEDGTVYLNPSAYAEARRQQQREEEKHRREERARAAEQQRLEEQARLAAEKERAAAERAKAAELERQREVEARSYGKLAFGENGCTNDLYLKGSWSDHPIGGKVDFVDARTGEVVYTDWPGKTGSSMVSAGYYRVCRSAGSEATGIEITR